MRGERREKREEFFQIARASILEVAACIDLMKIFKLVSDERARNWKDSIKQISLMLYALK